MLCHRFGIDLRLRKPLLAQILLLASLLGASGFLSNYTVLRSYEVGEACVLLLFVWLAFSMRINSRWATYVFLPTLGLVIFVLSYAYVFAAGMDTSLLPSVLAQRYYLFALLLPVICMLGMRGWKLADFRRVFVLAVSLTMVGRIVADITSPVSLLLSGSFFTLRLNEIYGEQAYLIRRLDSSALFLALYFGRGLMQARSISSRAVRLAVTALALTLLLITVPRGLLASVGIAIVLYGLLLLRPERAKLSVVLLPLYAAIVILSASPLINTFTQTFGQDPSYTTRAEEVRIAWGSILQHPFLGLGQDSFQALSFQDLFGIRFFPSDIGLLGVVFQFGLIGLLLYLAFGAWLFVNLLRMLWAHSGSVASDNYVFLWALFILCFTFIIISPQQARFIFGNGLPIAAFSSGLVLMHKRGLLSEPHEDPRKSPQAVSQTPGRKTVRVGPRVR